MHAHTRFCSTRRPALGLLALVSTLCLWLLPPATHAQDSSKPDSSQVVQAVTMHWPGQTNPDGTGTYFSLLREVFAQDKLTLQYQVIPWKRAQTLVQQKDPSADAIIGEYLYPDKDYIYPRWHFDLDANLVASYRANQPWNGAASLAGKRVAWIRGYDLQPWIPGTYQVTEVDTLDQGLKMLQAGRIDYLVDYDYNMTLLGAEYAMSVIIQRKKIYIAFANTPKGKALATTFDNRMDALLKSGQLDALYNKIGMEKHFDLVGK